MIQHQQLTFGRSLATTLTLTGAEQYCNQIGIHELSQHDLRVVYAPLTTNSASVKLEVRIYESDDGMTVGADDSQWHPFCYDENDGSGNFDSVIRVYRNPALTASILLRNPSRSFSLGAKKIRLSFLEAGSPNSFGSITSAYLSSRP